MPRTLRALSGAVATLAAGTLLVSVPMAAHADGLGLHVQLQQSRLTIPYGGTAAADRLLVGVGDASEVVTPPSVDVDLVSSAGAVTRVISGLRLGDQDFDYQDQFPSAAYYDYAAVASFTPRGLAAGTYSVRVTEVPAGDAVGESTSTALVLVDGIVPAVRTVTVRPNVATVFPVRDGYRDSVVFSIGGATTTGAAVATSGTAVLRRGGHVVQRWSLSSSTTKVTWNGRSHGAIVPGAYTLTATQKGRTGSAHTASAVVHVDRRALVARSVTAHYSATAVLGTRYLDYSSQNQASCIRDQYEYRGGYESGALYCEAYDDSRQSDGTNTAITVSGGLAIPAAVRRATAFGKPSVTVGQHTSVLANAAYTVLQAGSAISYGRATGNAYSSRTLRWSGNPSHLTVQFRLGSYCFAGVKDYTVTWRYKTLG